MPAITTIRDLAQIPGTWRKRLLPAHFNGYLFHVEVGSMEGGRRIVTHEFPKKELCYSEDMGRKATEFTVRGYIIQFVRDTGVDLYRRDYTIARNKLQTQLDTATPKGATLQLPMMRPMTVVCSRYRLTEEDKLGGYCTFDMTFVELGVPPFAANVDATGNLIAAAENLKGQIIAALSPSQGSQPSLAPTRTQIASGRPF